MNTIPPSTPPADSIPPEDKIRIEILLKEYDTLRAEALARINNRFTLIAVAAAAGALFSTKEATSVTATAQIAWLVALMVVGVIVWWWTGLLILRCSVRIAKIEAKIAMLAKDRSLLRWESINRVEQAKSWSIRLYPTSLTKFWGEDTP
jgi:hypothetical protein